ncbi:Sm domain-containing protein [Mycena kentingensis (nom. inval.)]|nr:Sm domain-containing protein [Mycena kentingensis (nom. inval.)]
MSRPLLPQMPLSTNMDEKTAYTDDPQGLPMTQLSDAELERQLRKQKKAKCKRAGRALKRLGLLGLLYWAGTAVFGYAEDFSALKHHRLPLPADTKVETCASWTEEPSAAAAYPYSASASLELPLNSEALFLVSKSRIRHARGTSLFSAGSVNFTRSDLPGDVVTIDITAEYARKKDLKAAHACLLSSTVREDERGVGILLKGKQHPNGAKRDVQMRFKGLVTFPAPSDGADLAVNAFRTDLEAYAQNFDPSMRGIHFKTLNLQSALGPITGKDVIADEARVHTGFGDIDIPSLASTHADLTTTVGRVRGAPFGG